MSIKVFLLALGMTIYLVMDGFAQVENMSLKDSLGVELKASFNQAHLSRVYMILSVNLKNLGKQQIYLLKNSCYDFEQFFEFSPIDIIIKPKRVCTFSYLTTQSLAPKESFQFEVELWMLKGFPKKELEIGFELVVVPERYAEEHISLLSDEEQDKFETFTFWKKIERCSFRIDIPPLRI